MNAKILPTAQSSNYKWWVFSAIAVGLFTSVAEASTVIVALPTIADEFGTDLPTTQWVLIGFALAVCALLLPMGRLADLVGRKRIYIVGFVIFVIGAALAGTSGSILLLILFRVLMGVGAAMTQGSAMAMLVSSFPNTERGKALGLQLSVVGMGAVIGPAAGGFIITALDWRWIFFITAMLGVLAILAAQLILDERQSRQDTTRSAFDWPGAVLSASVLLAFLFILSNGPSVGWRSPPIIVATLSTIVLLGAFVWWELRTPTPMLDVRLFKGRLFSFGISSSFLSFIGMSSVRFLVPFYLQAVLGYSPHKIALIIAASALTMIITGPLSGPLSDRYGWRKFNVSGLLLSAVGLFMLSRLTVDSSLGLVLAAMLVHGIGLGTFTTPNSSSVLSTVEQSKYGVVSGFLNMIRNAGHITGTVVVTAIVTATMASKGLPPTLAMMSDSKDIGTLVAFTEGLRIAYLTMGCLMLLGVALSFAKGGRPPRHPLGDHRS